MRYDLIIGRYGEIALKSPRTRKKFENKLIKNIKTILDCKINLNQARLFIYPEDFDKSLEILSKIFGIVSYSPAISLRTNLEDIKKYLTAYVVELENLGLISAEKSFAVRTRRVGEHEMSSQEFSAFAGSVVVDNIGSSVNLTNPDITIFLEIRGEDTYIFHEKIEGAGGLPLGTQGRLVVLVSSGIDSPVASYLMMKRGCEIVAIHFNNAPFSDLRVTENFKKLVNQLGKYAAGSEIKTVIIDYGEYLTASKEHAPERLTCLLCKSGMYKIAGKIAERENALAIVDGSSLGQVASQTLPNILATRDGIELPILSPLIGFDKVEIERIARKIGTFPFSESDDGGCSAVPRYPETKADLSQVNLAKKSMKQDEEIDKIINKLLLT